MASLPESLVDRDVFVLDPMLATGGSLVHCCGLLTDRGADRHHRALRARRAGGAAAAGGERPAAAGVHRQRRRAAQRATPTSSRASATPATASSARSDHALRRPRHRLLGPARPRGGARRAPRRRARRRLGPRPRQGQGGGRGVRRRRLRRPRRAARRGRRRRDRAAARRAGAAGRAGRRGRQAPAAGEADRARPSTAPTGWSTAVARRRRGLGRLLHLAGSSTATSTWLEQAARTTLAGGRGDLAGAPSPAPRSTTRPGARSTARCGTSARTRCRCSCPTLGPVAPCRPARGLRRHRAPGARARPGGRASTVTLSHTVAPMSAGIEVFVHGDAGRLVLLPEYERADRARSPGRRRRADRPRRSRRTARTPATPASAATSSPSWPRPAGAGLRLPGAGRADSRVMRRRPRLSAWAAESRLESSIVVSVCWT